MKRLIFGFIAVMMISCFAWRCTKDATSSTSQTSLKQSLSSSMQSVGLAVNSIQGTAGYKVLSSGSSSSLKSDSSVTITIDSLRGIYDFHPVVAGGTMYRPFYKFFNKTASTTDFIIRLPAPKVYASGELGHFFPKDTTLKNNFVISVSDYYVNINPFAALSTYRLASSVTVSDTAAGQVSINANNTASGYTYTASYSFGNGYSAQTQTIAGDSIISTNSILSGSTVVYQEKVVRNPGNMMNRGERQYILTIGNVQIKRIAQDSTQVYVGGVLQTKAKVVMLDGTASKMHGRQCHLDAGAPGLGYNRDLQITFDDGTTTTISALAGSAITNVTAVFASLQQVNFASHVVDWIASDIYFKKIH